MATSGKTFELEEALPVLMPSSILKIMSRLLNDNIRFNAPIEMKPTGIPFTIFGKNVQQMYEEKLTDYTDLIDACPVALYKEIEKNPDKLFREIETRDGVFILLQLALIHLDFTIKVNTFVTDLGIVDKLLEFHRRYFPEREKEALLLAKTVSPVQSIEMKDTQYLANSQALNKVFEAIKEQKNVNKAIDELDKYIISTKPEFMSCNTFHLNILRLQYQAYSLSGKRAVAELGGSQSLKTKEFYNVIGRIIQPYLPNRCRQILMKGPLYVFRSGVKVDRKSDFMDIHFLGQSGTKKDLRTKGFYDDFGYCNGRSPRSSGGYTTYHGPGVFKEFYKFFLDEQEYHGSFDPSEMKDTENSTYRLGGP